jgi:hypothetical protein
MATVTKKFRHNIVVMLTAISTVVENAIKNKAAIIAKRATWADPFLPNLKARIDTVVQTYLGIDTAKELRNATQTLVVIQNTALDKLSFFQLQIKQDFKKNPIRRDEILNTLGFNDYYAQAYKNDSQDALINLLYQFKKNMDATLKAEITTKGTDAASITEIVSFADSLKNSNVSQETFKSNRTVLTEQATIVFNDLYDDVIAVGTISAGVFKKDKALKETFSYTKLANAQQAALKAKKTPVTPTP